MDIIIIIILSLLVLLLLLLLLLLLFLLFDQCVTEPPCHVLFCFSCSNKVD